MSTKRKCIGRTCLPENAYIPEGATVKRYRERPCERECKDPDSKLCSLCTKYQQAYLEDPSSKGALKFHGVMGQPLPPHSHIRTENESLRSEWNIKTSAKEAARGAAPAKSKAAAGGAGAANTEAAVKVIKSTATAAATLATNIAQNVKTSAARTTAKRAARALTEAEQAAKNAINATTAKLKALREERAAVAKAEKARKEAEAEEKKRQAALKKAAAGAGTAAATAERLVRSTMRNGKVNRNSTVMKKLDAFLKEKRMMNSVMRSHRMTSAIPNYAVRPGAAANANLGVFPRQMMAKAASRRASIASLPSAAAKAASRRASNASLPSAAAKAASRRASTASSVASNLANIQQDSNIEEANLF